MHRLPKALLSVLALAFVAACGEGGQSPTGTPADVAPAAEQVMAVHTPETDFWWGYSNGAFWIEVDPRRANVIVIGGSRLTIPANSICDLETTSYGSSEWDKPCTAETSRVRFTIKLSKSISGRSRLDVLPHVRFVPSNLPMLRLYDPSLVREQSFEILYCATELNQAVLGGCINEALTDPSLKTYRQDDYFFRMLKHFSGYEVAAT